eukprot:COSAG05_NODE_13508_length_427_cov_0.935976_2_plen_26_part_01
MSIEQLPVCMYYRTFHKRGIVGNMVS